MKISHPLVECKYSEGFGKDFDLKYLNATDLDFLFFGHGLNRFARIKKISIYSEAKRLSYIGVICVHPCPNIFPAKRLDTFSSVCLCVVLWPKQSISVCVIQCGSVANLI